MSLDSFDNSKLLERAIYERQARRIRENAVRGRALIPDPDTLRLPDILKLHKDCSTTLGFTRLFWPVIEPDREFVDGWHLGCVGEHLDEVSNPHGCIKDLIINVPPRTMKSLLTCVFWFAKTWATRPGSRWMFASFGGDLVQRDSQRCREIVATPLYQRLWDVRIKKTQDTQLRYTNQHQGFRYAVTVGGQGMGEGADFLVIDDPQNPKRAASAIERENTIRWYRATFSRRVNDERTARRVLIMQRLNERDLTGYLIAEQTGWDQLVLPMRYEPRRYFYGFDVPPPPGMIPERELEDAASPQPVEAPRLKLHDPNTSPDKFNLPAAERSDTRPRAPKRLDLVGQFLDSLKKLEPGAPAADPEPGTKADRPVEAKVEAVAGAVPTPPPPAEERKPPRDCIRPTKLQWKNPKLLDGPAGSGRQDEGDLLWGKRFPLEQVEKAEEELGPDAPGQYGQRPTGEAGDIFKEETFRRYEPVWDTDEDKETGALRTYFGRVRLYGPTDGEVREFRASHCTWFQTVDTALTESRRSAFTAILTFGVTPEYDLLLWHVFRGRLNVQYQYPLIKAMKLGPVHWLQKQHKMIPAGAWPFKIAVQAVEAKASGLGIIQEAASDGNPLHPLKADTDKVTRAVPVAGMYGAGKVYHPYAGPRWLTDMEEELKQFPNGAYKDISDCVAHAGQMVVHDKIIRALCHGRAMAYTDADEVLPPDNVTEVDVNGAKVRVEWPEDGGPRNPPGGFGGYKNLFDGFFGGGGGGDNG